MTIQSYLDTLNLRYKTGISREHTYRGDLQTLLMSILPDILVTNEPSRVSCGAPDYVLTRKDIPIGYIEAKDIGIDLKSKSLKEQFDRYREGLSNLIFTDYLDFHFYKDGIFISSIAIAKIENQQIVPLPQNFENFQSLIKNFAVTVSQTIKSPTKLAEMMAGKAKLMADVIEKSLNHDDETQTRSALKNQMLSFKQMLIHDINNQAFADIYSQTIAYGMFAARYHDPTLPTFSRQEAATLIPKSNPFLRKLFQDIAGYDLDDRLVWIVEELVSIFLATDVADIMKNFGKSTKQEDPVVHFYETFLAAYNPALRKARGVWYTPQPVVNFIVRAVDDILKTEFNLPQGLADTSKIKIKTKHTTKATADQRSKLKEVEQEQEVHRVQILDPATGTGTFLAEVVKHIYKKFEGQQGIWSNYVNQHLIPRLNGFELLMASYAMAHLKMDMLLTETGYKSTNEQRFRIFLTNSLEEAHPDTGTLFSSWLSDEADQANAVKRDTPVMVIMGNPPYSGESANKGDWIMGLMEDYKKEPGGKEKLKERNPKWINDDYVKFLRYGQHFIEKNGSGVLAFINPHGFLDNPTFRGMRWNLLKTYDKIYTIDLHGNSKKKEVAPDGSIDVNVFDIQQGVSINLFVKTGDKKESELGKVFHYDLYGKREFKYDFLNENSLKSVRFSAIPNKSPMYFMVQKDFEAEEIYNLGFKIDELFTQSSVGIVTSKDAILINENKEDLISNVEDFYSLEAEKSVVEKISYRPFDERYIYYDTKLIERAREKVMKNFLTSVNLGLVVGRQSTDEYWCNVQVSECLIDNRFHFSYKGISSLFPLYLYPETNSQLSIGESQNRVPNLNMEIVREIEEKLGLHFVAEKTTSPTPPKEGLSQPGYVTANPLNYKLIKEMRDVLKDNPTEAEKVIWEYLRNKKTGHKIRRQHIIDDFITDFVCLSKKTVIEIDGKIHLLQKEYDELRSARLKDLGYTVIRFTNEEVFKNPEAVAQKIKQTLDQTPTSISPPSEGPGEVFQVPQRQEYPGEFFQNKDTSISPPSEGPGEVYSSPSKEPGEVFTPIDLLDYIYAVLHSPTYREKYKEFLKIDFPRVPYPTDTKQFFKLVALGRQIRELHLLESSEVEDLITQYPIDGDNVVVKPDYELDELVTYKENDDLVEITNTTPPYFMGKVYINENQYFDHVPEAAWNFYIGGYQPAQKWLKDRKGRELNFEDILHYQKMIVALKRTGELMGEIDGVLVC